METAENQFSTPADVVEAASAPPATEPDNQKTQAEPPQFKAGLKLLEVQRDLEKRQKEFEERAREFETERETMASKAKRADLKLQDLFEEAEAGLISHEEMVQLAERLLYVVHPDKAPPEHRLGLEARKFEREKKRMQAEYEAKLAEAVGRETETAEARAIAEARREYEAETAQEVSARMSEIPYAAAKFGSVEKLSEVVMSIASRNSETGGTIEPSEIIQYIESELRKDAELYAKVHKPKAPDRHLPVSEDGYDLDTEAGRLAAARELFKSFKK